MNRRFALVVALGLSTLATVAQVDTAEAGRYRFGGGGHVRVHARVGVPSVSVRYARGPRVVPRRWSVGGSVYVGPRYRYRYYRPYYYRPYYYYQPIPSYYGYYEQSYYPVAPAPAAAPATTVAVTAPAPRQELPKLGIGVFAGGVSIEDKAESSDIGVLGRFRLTPGLLIEGEIGKTSYEDDLRVDRRLGASLVYEIGAYNRLAPYVLGGFGAQQAEVGGEYTTTQHFAELGIGLRYALSPNLHILFDVRAGSRASVSSDAPTVVDVAARTIDPPAVDSDEHEDYTRARLSAALYF